MSSSACPAASEPASPPSPSIPEEKLLEVEKLRAAKKPVAQLSGKHYGLICPLCTKPNTISTSFCTGCKFPLDPRDLSLLPDNIFLDLVNGKDIGCVVHLRTERLIVFDDKFPVSNNHLDIIPTAEIEDIRSLTDKDIPMLEELMAEGKKILLARNIPGINEANIDEFLSAGYNFPVSVKHLHLHLLLPPYFHEKVLQYPRWHSQQKVLDDLRQYGKVRTWQDFPDEKEGLREPQRALDNHAKLVAIQAKLSSQCNQGC